MYKIFAGLTSLETEKIKSATESPSRFKKGDELYKNGYIALIESGKATVKRISSNGQSLTIRTVFDGEIFGAASIFGKWEEGASSVIAETDGSIIYFSEDAFKKILYDFPAVSLNYIKYLTERIRFLNRRIDAFSADSTEERLYEFLTSQKDINGSVDISIGITNLARILHVGRTSLYRDIESLERKGLIKKENKKITVY